MDLSTLFLIGLGAIGVYLFGKRFSDINKKIGSLEKRGDALVDHLQNVGLTSSKTIKIEPEKFKELFELPLISKSFNSSKVDSLDKKPSEIQELLKTSNGWLKHEGVKYPF